jgi:uncharacterized integral membrane protein
MIILLLSIIITLIIVTFAVQNAAVVTVQFFLWTTNVPLVLIIIGSFFLGALIMFLISLGRDLKKKINKPIKIKETKDTASNQQSKPVQNEAKPGEQKQTEQNSTPTNNSEQK